MVLGSTLNGKEATLPIGSVDWVEDGMLLGPVRELGDDRYEVDVRNQFFHGAHPLGWIRDLTVTIDGRAAEDLHLVIRDQAVPLALVRTTTDIWWYPREIAALRFHISGLPRGARARIGCRFAVSTFFFTPAIDRDDHYPSMRLDLSGEFPRVPVRTP